MIKPREQLEEKLDKLIHKNIEKTELQNNIAFYLEDNYKLSILDSLEYLHGDKKISEADDFTLFCLADGFDVEGKTNLITQFYSDLEIKEKKTYQFKESEINFPLTFKMIQVADDSWIGRTDTDTLVKLQDTGLISYVENGKMFYSKKDRVKRPYFIGKAIEEIQKCLHNGMFIPNTITLNIELGEGKFHYNEKSGELVVEEIKAFNIIDGRYRLHAIIMEKNVNPEFNYPMELRITNYDELKVKQFIYQEEQKINKKSNIKVYDVNEYGNKIINRLNTDARCVIQGKIGMSEDYLIMHHFLLAIINSVYLKNTSNAELDSKWLVIEKELVDCFNNYCEVYPETLNGRLTLKELLTIIYVNYLEKHEGVDVNDVVVTAHKTLEIINSREDIPVSVFVIRYGAVKGTALKLIREVVLNES